MPSEASQVFVIKMKKSKTLLSLTVLILGTLACNALIPPVPTATPIPTQPTQTNTPEPINTPLTENQVKRVTVEDAKNAFDNEAAIFVDVRSEQSFELSHIPGAINIQLGEFETDPTGLNLPKDQWIITYCT